MTSRRDFLAGATACSAALILPKMASAAAAFDPRPGEWRTFGITTRIAVAKPVGTAQVWVPLPSVHEDAWMVPVGDKWSGNAASAEIATDPKHGAKLLHATFSTDQPWAVLEVESRIRMRTAVQT